MNEKEIRRLVGEEHQDEIKKLLEENDGMLRSLSLRDPNVTLLLSIFLGMFGIDRLYQAGIKVCLCKLALMVFSVGTWWLIDIGYSKKMTQQMNYDKIIAAA